MHEIKSSIMVRKSRHSSFGVNPDADTERPEDRPGYRRNATTMSKISRRGNTSAREYHRDNSISQFTGQINSHGIHLHVRVTAHHNNQVGQKQSADAGHRSNHAQLSPGARNVETGGEDKMTSGRHYTGNKIFENDTGMVTNSNAQFANGRESRRSQQRRLASEGILPPIDSGVVGMSTHRAHADFPSLEMPVRQASFGTPTARSPITKPVTADKHGRYLIRDKTVSTMESVKLPDCSPAASGIKRKRRKNLSFMKDQKDRTMNGKINENSRHVHASLTDLTKKLQISQEPEIPAYDRLNADRPVLERSHDNVDEEWKLYSSMGSNPGQEPLTIRKKIEQFKKWHESQSKEKGQGLKLVDSESASGEETVKKAENSETESAQSPGEIVPQGAETRQNNRDTGTRLPEVNSTARPKSARSWITWKTWRGVNESYAYNDVKKYIEDNELMTDEKEDWIQKWVDTVDREFFANKRSDADCSVSGGSSGGATV